MVETQGLQDKVLELGKKLSKRTERDDLVQRNILREDELSVSPSIIQAKMALEKEKANEALNRKLARRPSKVDLKLRNILRVDSSESLDQSATGLEKSINFDERSAKLKSCLKRRPEKSELEGVNILKATDIDPSLAATQERLKRAQLELSLDHKLRDRPNEENPIVRRALEFNETVEVVTTFRKSEYNRKPDSNATFRKLTPSMKVHIREELNAFKKHEMEVHEQSLRNTCFH
ncbi:hypothetical protein BJ742DRAFT_751944 [Cladochytrium replicatum]|nr:hypothetical protein BJ742DRAFT_751944 [Cladochytrium replicatum]